MMFQDSNVTMANTLESLHQWIYARFTTIKHFFFVWLPLYFASERLLEKNMNVKNMLLSSMKNIVQIRNLKSLWLQKILSWKENMWKGRVGEGHKAILLLRFRWTTISFHSKGRRVVGPFRAINIAFMWSHSYCIVDWFPSLQMNHMKGRETVESFIALWQSRFSFLSLYKTLNGSTINCIIKELRNLLISTKALCDTECVIFSGSRGREMGSDERTKRQQIPLLFNLPYESRSHHDKTFFLLPHEIDLIISRIFSCMCAVGKSMCNMWNLIPWDMQAHWKWKHFPSGVILYG